MKRILLVNPWIADVAAYNFWFRPLGLYEIASWIDARGGTPLLADTLAGTPAPGKFERRIVAAPHPFLAGIKRRFARYGMAEEGFVAMLKKMEPFRAAVITSGMSYWYPGIQWITDIIRRRYPGTQTVLGGIYATLWHEHAKKYSGADHVIKGSLAANSKLLARLLELPEKPVREARPWYELGLHDGVDYAAIRITEGCPFRCTYCASRLLSDGFAQRNIKVVFNELECLYNLGVRQAAFYDDALLVNFKSHLRPLLAKIRKAGLRYRFHTPNAMHAGLVDMECAESLMAGGFETVRMGLETVNPVRQGTTGGKVRNRDVKRAVRLLHGAGFRPDAIGIYLLAGLPGQTVDEIRQGIFFVKELGARPFIAEFSPIPGTIEWTSLEKAGVVSLAMDPLLTNNSVFCHFFHKTTGQGISPETMLELRQACVLKEHDNVRSEYY